jgi:hypothetical protein
MLLNAIVSAENCVEDWYDPDYPNDLYDYALQAYICHLADIIDRMEIALETASRWAECGTCEVEHIKECSGGIECNYRIYDGFLLDAVEEDVERYIDDAD